MSGLGIGQGVRGSQGARAAPGHKGVVRKKWPGKSPAKSNREVKLMRVSSIISVTVDLGADRNIFKI